LNSPKKGFSYSSFLSVVTQEGDYDFPYKTKLQAYRFPSKFSLSRGLGTTHRNLIAVRKCRYGEPQRSRDISIPGFLGAFRLEAQR